jgi:tRNA-2-methylthio-N6-dimethylallyladenosine synthase
VHGSAAGANAQAPAVDLVAGPAQLPQVPDLIARLRGQHDKLLAVTADIRRPVSQTEDQALDTFEQDFDSDANQLPGQAFVRIMRGCNKFCSYCVVPFVRGPEQSRSPATIVEQARKLADRGIRQVTLLGQTVNSYRHAEGDRTVTLVDLIERISRIDGIHWIRFITSHPKPFDGRIFQAMADNPKVCRYLHIPAQSGSDPILKAMNRGYTCDDYIRLIDGARQIVPDLAVAGDFIVGFPGESDQDFEATCELVRRIRYKNCFIFKYSPRPGTRADEKLADSVAEEVKKRRNIALLELQNKISEQDNRILSDRPSSFRRGPSKNPHRTHPETQASATGRPDGIGFHCGLSRFCRFGRIFLSVRIVKASALTLFGEVLLILDKLYNFA